MLPLYWPIACCDSQTRQPAMGRFLTWNRSTVLRICQWERNTLSLSRPWSLGACFQQQAVLWVLCTMERYRIFYNHKWMTWRVKLALTQGPRIVFPSLHSECLQKMPSTPYHKCPRSRKNGLLWLMCRYSMVVDWFLMKTVQISNAWLHVSTFLSSSITWPLGVLRPLMLESTC